MNKCSKLESGASDKDEGFHI